MTIVIRKAVKRSASRDLPPFTIQDLPSTGGFNRHSSVYRSGSDRLPRKVALKDLFLSKKSTESTSNANSAQESLQSVISSSDADCSRSVGACRILAKLVDAGIVAENEPVSYLRKKDKSVLKEGKITRDGILCKCCRRLFTLSKFEFHAGSTLHRPCANIFLQDGRSLMQCQQASELNLKNNHTYERGHEYVRTETDSSSFFIPRKRCVAEFIYEKKDVKHLDTVKQDVKQLWEDDSDDFCEICGEGGQLMLCDSCPSAFHPSCLNFEAVPDGDWHCSRCQCHRCGRGPQLNSFETKMISCSQCLSMYHRCCVTDQNFANMVTDPWFCSSICRSVFKRLQGLVGRMFSLENGIQWMLLGSLETKHGRDNERMKDVRKCLSRAYKLLDQCFDPIVDQKSGVDLLSQMIFSGESHLKRLDCRGFYTIVLMEGEQLISAATVRIHGNSVAEMPLIGTNIQFRNQGMCKLLMKALQGMLKNIGVHELVLPSIPHLVESWVGSFGFKLISSDVWEERILSANLLPFPGTTLLHKTLRHS